ncbi:hypothetical protein AB5J62_31565 [Amycolatopsis sp. cg5]|uniref:hypothetical protein n=1 Tax=Amycolatopsis sp. cg5 TaxID=3238802 RepID=UPI003525F1B0
MQKTITRTLLTGAIAGSVLMLLPGAAFAGPASHTCPRVGERECATLATGFPGGTISVDADSHGNGTASWEIRGVNTGFRCSASFEMAAGPQSWVCRNAPADDYAGVVRGYGPLNIGIRW